MKMEDHFKETLRRAVANEPPVLDAWDTFERRVHRGRRVRLFASLAGAAALIAAAAIVVPKLTSNDRVITPNSPGSTAPTVDQYAGWPRYENAQWGLSIRYPQGWVNSPFEGVQEFHPSNLPGLEPGMPTFAVTVFLLPGSYDTIEPGPGTTTNGTASAGQPYIRVEQPGQQITYLIDWNGQCGAMAACTMRVMLIAPHGSGSPSEVATAHDLWTQYKDDGERIVASITKTPALVVVPGAS